MSVELPTALASERLRYLPKEKRKTLTLDNGVEFSDWEHLEKKSGVTIYFAYPYHSWERGTNENTKWTSSAIFPEEVHWIFYSPFVDGGFTK